MYHQQTNKYQQTIEQIEVIQEEFSPEVSNLQWSFSREKKE